jgi:hypothetical protein
LLLPGCAIPSWFFAGCLSDPPLTHFHINMFILQLSTFQSWNVFLILWILGSWPAYVSIIVSTRKSSNSTLNYALGHNSSQQCRFLSFSAQKLLSSLAGNCIAPNPFIQLSNWLPEYNVGMDNIENTVSNNSSIVTEMCLSSCISTDVFSGYILLAFIRHVTTLWMPYLFSMRDGFVYPLTTANRAVSGQWLIHMRSSTHDHNVCGVPYHEIG